MGGEYEQLELKRLDIRRANFIDVQDCCWEFFKRYNFRGRSQIQMGATVGKIRVTGENFSIKSVRRIDC